MSAADHPREIASTPRRAAQAITTETVHHSMKKKRNTRQLTRLPRSTQHHRKVPNTRRVTQPKQHSSKITRKDKTIKRKDKIKKPHKKTEPLHEN
jgi:hypothetical protein